MRSHPRIRKTIKWVRGGGAAVTVPLVVVWIGSGWWAFGHNANSGYGSVWIRSGALAVSVWHLAGRAQHAPLPLALRGRRFVSHRESFHWLYSYSDYPTVDERWEIPLWPVVLASIVTTALAWRLDTLARRRERLGLCPKCRYDRAGLVGGAKDAV
ncbi:MAG TPA: hypothetical protein PKE29_05540 [Phycisphaerales bacterium]|nr:hypothetical protein [Phycisphaerales bacterium]